MSTKRKESKRTEFLGVNHIAQLVNHSNCIFNKIDESNDQGLDAYIEFIENESATGLCIGVQIKSGDSYQSSDKRHAVITADFNHFEYWKNHILPLAGIVYIPEDDSAYWVDLSDHLKDNDLSGPYTVRLSKENILTPDTFQNFYEHFSPYRYKYNSDWNFGKALKGLVPSNNANTRIESIKSLFHFHRNEIESWYYLINQFSIENNFDIENLLIYIMRHLISHGDIYWHDGNIVNESIRKNSKRIIAENFAINEIAKLLRHIDENGIIRGSIGQNIYPIIDLVPDKVEILKKIILNEFTDDDSRAWAGIILINEFQFDDLDRAINFAESMINNFPNSEHREQFELIRDSLKHDGFVDFRG
ncbi:DUF4365 domain-containing protein [Sphingobacterium sp. LRF_L2]|uniref:DUF4365 domain-containing protein n=1 Tax=Sphingobacterium sp. LRF_L2 TaxID=3369421 RepID=UPI003F626867